MYVYTFHAHLESPIMDGIKNHTIRKNKRLPKAGDQLSLRVWTGRPYWSKQKKLIEARCTNVQKIHIGLSLTRGKYVEVDGLYLPQREVDRLAFHDGFDDGEAMFAYFDKHHGLNFTGHLISWG